MAKHRHFRIEKPPTSSAYLYPGGPPRTTFNLPARNDRQSHARNLRRNIEQALEDAAQSGQPQEREGIALEFCGEPGCDLIVDQLDRSRAGIELSNVRRTPNGTAATVYVPPGKIPFFFQLMDRCSQIVDEGANAPQGQKLFDSIALIRRATIAAFWTDNQPFPEDPAQSLWWEVWVRSGNTTEEHEAAFERFAASIGNTDLHPGMGFIRFPERLVLLIRGSVNEWSNHSEVLNLVAELRQAKEIPTDLIEMAPADQGDFAADAAARIAAAPVTAPAVCVLDTGRRGRD